MYDPYYETRVTPIWGIQKTGFAIGALLLAFGVILNIFTIVDLCTGFYGIEYVGMKGPDQHTMGIWPWFGRASWVGLLVMAAGIAGIVSNQEATNCSIYAFISTVMAAVFFCVYLVVCESIVINVYAALLPDLTVLPDPVQTYAKNELAMTCLNLIFAVFSILAGVAGAMAACGAVGCCRSRRRTNYAPILPGRPLGLPTTRPAIYRR